MDVFLLKNILFLNIFSDQWREILLSAPEEI